MIRVDLVVKSETLGWTGYVTYMGIPEMHVKFCVETYYKQLRAIRKTGQF